MLLFEVDGSRFRVQGSRLKTDILLNSTPFYSG
jgi:hypothetical protein